MAGFEPEEGGAVPSAGANFSKYNLVLRIGLVKTLDSSTWKLARPPCVEGVTRPS